METVRRITLAWWNTTLSPHTKENTASKEHKEYVTFILLRLLKEESVDMFCLCEVSSEDIDYISSVVGENYEIYNGTYRQGRKKFDLCVVFRPEKFEFLDSSVVSGFHVSKKIYAGQKVEFQIIETGESLNLFLVHWSSRLYDYEDSPKKAELGVLLRNAVYDCFNSSPTSKIIIMGDFNEEPFNKSITDHLAASRDIALVKKTPRLLYNPFWRHLVYKKLHPHSETSDSHGGTYYYKSDGLSKWKTFDQMIFSSGFINGETWQLNESETIVYSNPEFIDYIKCSKSKFDHLPIIAVIERTNCE